MKIIDIKTEKGYLITAKIFEADSKTILIIASATGVKQEFYNNFANFVSRKGITVITFDYAGIGLSLKQPIKQHMNNVVDWGENDLEAIIKFTKDNYKNAKITLIGHSIGGQIIGLAKSSLDIQKVVLVAAQSGYWKLWKGKDKFAMWLNWHLLFPLLIKFYGYLPSKSFSRMENLPKNVAKQWSNWGKNPNYLFDEVNYENLYYKKMKAKVISISIQNDFFAPIEAVEWLTKKYEKAEIKRIHIKPSDYYTNEIGHFGIFKSKFENTLWKLLSDEVEK